MNQAYDVIIVGGGSAGISVAARLRRAARDLKIGLFEPSERHYYQPLFTLVGGGDATLEETVRPTAALIPDGVDWLRERVTGFDPERNLVQSEKGAYSYGSLVICPGIQINWGAVAGLTDTLGKNGVCSNYDPRYVTATWDMMKGFKGGRALFTFPASPVKCAGAPQKIMYLAEDYFRRQGLRDDTQIFYYSALPAIFGVKKYAAALDKIVASRGIQTRFRHNLVAIDGPARQATFRHLDSGETVTVPYDFIHVTPPMSAPDFVKTSPLANADGWVDVNRNTLQHVRYPNVFSLGDASSLPTSKTGAAIRKQAPILVRHLLAQRSGQALEGRYDGYTSCPLVTGYGKLILAEFDYDGNPQETFPFDQGKERLSMYLLKKHGLPRLYWHGMLRGVL